MSNPVEQKSPRWLAQAGNQTFETTSKLPAAAPNVNAKKRPTATMSPIWPIARCTRHYEVVNGKRRFINAEAETVKNAARLLVEAVRLSKGLPIRGFNDIPVTPQCQTARPMPEMPPVTDFFRRVPPTIDAVESVATVLLALSPAPDASLAGLFDIGTSGEFRGRDAARAESQEKRCEEAARWRSTFLARADMACRTGARLTPAQMKQVFGYNLCETGGHVDD